MVQLTVAQKKLVQIASLLGITQGLAWFVMSLLCIIQYNRQNPPESLKSYMDIFNFLVYTKFLNRHVEFESSTVVTPQGFTVFMWIYLIADAFWVIISLALIQSANRNKPNLINLLRVWGILTLLISCVDFLLAVFIGRDFHEMTVTPAIPGLQTGNIVSFKIINEMICTNVMIPVLVIAARGFVLWIVNVIFVYIVYAIVKDLKLEVLNRYAGFPTNGTIPRPTFQTNSGVQNPPQNFWNENRNFQDNSHYPNQQPFRY